MDESVGKTSSSSSSLAITEKQTTATTQRPGGCVGIFFQLFDWNRKFAKKKLFSKKFLPPVRAKQASKKFRGDEKMPTSKLHLIADENKGGFPNMKKLGNRSVDSEHKNYETRAPGLVARLMGLESMPAVREKPKKLASFSDACENGENKFVNNNFGTSGTEREDMSLERGNVKVDSRPQKLQKTGQFERKAVTRFGAESAFQMKSVLSRSRKYHHQHPKFVSPVKSPRIPSAKNVSRTSRLIDAATKILEPGLQSTSRARNALTYSTSIHYHPSNETVTERMEVKPEEQSKQSGYCTSAAKSLMGQTSCKNCGNLLDVVDCRPNVDEEPSGFPSIVPNFANGSSEGTERSNPRMPVSCSGQAMEPVFQRNLDQPMSLGVQKKEETGNMQSNNKPISERKSLSHGGLVPWPSSSKPCTFQSNVSTSVNKQRTQIQEQMPFGRDRTPPKSNPKLNNLESRKVSSAASAISGSKDFVSLNRSLSGRTRPRVPTKVESSNKFVPEKKAFNRRDESLPPLRSSVRKRRTVNVDGQMESRGFVSSPATKPRNVQCDSFKGKGFGFDAHSMNHTCVRSRSTGPTEHNRVVKSNSNDIISFTFNSPIRQKIGTSMGMEEKNMDDETKNYFQKPLSLKGDSIAALLEQKLKELTSQEDDEFAIGAPPKRTTATILQELISALTAERPDIASPSTAGIKHEKYAGFCHTADHLSPGSVLEASFSSSSLDGSSGHRICTDSMDCSSDQLHYPSDWLRYLGPDADLLDSATSFKKEVASCERVTTLVSNVCRTLDSMNIAGVRLTGSSLSHSKDVIVNAELLFRNALNIPEGLFIGPILLELETSANLAWTSIIFSATDANKGGNQSTGFLFDCLLEWLDFKYVKCHYLGFRAWTRLLYCMNRERIIAEVEKEIKKWTSLAGMVTDEIVEWEMSHGLGKWIDFDIEAFESGNEVCGEILEALVDETLIDLWEQGCLKVHT